jgi:hypothetical protein
MNDFAGSDEYTQILVDRIRELEAQVSRLKAGIRVTDLVCDSLISNNRKLRAEIKDLLKGAKT